jgi:hypothetical protein
VTSGLFAEKRAGLDLKTRGVLGTTLVMARWTDKNDAFIA